MDNKKMKSVYANLLYEKLENETDKSKIAKALDDFFVATRRLEKYSKKYMGGLDYDAMKCYVSFVVGMTRTLKQTCFMEKKTAEEFYNLLWGNIKDNNILSTRESRIFALWLIAQRGELPFHEIKFAPMRIDDEKFEELIKKNEIIIDKLSYIYNLSFSQRTEVASLILNEILSMEDFEDQVLVFSIITQMMLHKEEFQSKVRDVCMRHNS